MPIFGVIEATAFSTWLRESSSIFGFWLVLSFHAVGMGILVSSSVLIALRFLGAAPSLPMGFLARLYPAIWTGFWLQIGSGIILLIAYPTKNLTNFDFYVKLALIAIAMTTLVRLKRVVLDRSSSDERAMISRGRLLAIFALVSWIAAVTAGRWLAYTATYLTYPG